MPVSENAIGDKGARELTTSLRSPDRDWMIVKHSAWMNERISFLFTSSDCSLGDEATPALIDALQSPHCRLTNSTVEGESGPMCSCEVVP